MLETAILMPIVLVLIFIAILKGFGVNVESSLNSALSQGVRLAYSRGDLELSGNNGLQAGVAELGGLIPSIDSWINSGCSPALFPTIFFGGGISKNLAYLNFRIKFQTVMGVPLIQTCALSASNRGVKSSLLRSFYALAYVYKGIEESIGKLKYPCRVGSSDFNAGCLSCYTLNWGSYSTNGNGEAPAGIPFIGGTAYNYDWVGIRCVLAPQKEYTAPIAGLITLMMGSNVSDKILVTRDAVYPL